MFKRYHRATGELRSERQETSRLLGNLRAAVDPPGFYAKEDIEVAAGLLLSLIDR